MNGVQEFEMPSPKRMRLEAQSPDTTSNTPLPADDMEDIYGTPPVSRVIAPSVTQDYTQAIENMSSPAIEHLPQLPGLGLLNHNSSPSKEERQGIGQDVGPQRPELTARNVGGIANAIGVEQEMRHPEEAAARDRVNTSGKSLDISYETPQSPSPTSANASLEITRPEVRVFDESAPAERAGAALDSKLDQAAIEPQSQESDAGTEKILDSQMIAGIKPPTEAALEFSHGISTTSDTNKSDSVVLEAGELIKASETIAVSGPDVREVADANKSNEEAEFEMDSSPLISSSSDVSSDTSSSDEDSEAEDYVMLDPEEAVRRLMAEDGGSDEDRPGKGGKGTSGGPRTLNEKPDEIVPKPSVTITPDMRLEELGQVENLIDNIALVKANTSGEYQVLESGSVLCLEDRSVIGVVAETLGRVQQPFYSIRFTNAAAMAEDGIKQDTKIFYVRQLSHTVFTQRLKACKGSDASNLHDEEIGDDEIEFSDDEAEAEHKRQVKLQKQAKRDTRRGQAEGFSRGPHGVSSSASMGYDHGLSSWPEHSPNPTDPSLNYDDVKESEADELYTPLARPSNLHEMMAGKPPSLDRNADRGSSHRGGRDRGGRDRGRGGRGRGNRGGDRSGRGDRKDQGSRGGSRNGNHGGTENFHAKPSVGQSSPSTAQGNGFSQVTQSGVFAHLSQGSDHGQQAIHSNGFQSHESPQHSSMPMPVHQAQSQIQSYPNYLTQYPNAYEQPYSQSQQYQNYPSQYSQQQYNHQYYQPQQSSPQDYQANQAFTYPQFPAQQIPPSPSIIPPGAHINPNFFRQPAQSQSQQWWRQQHHSANANPNEWPQQNH
ncbi:H/ACA ribonucleoprotein complex non-core subunit NAF1, partial [Lecanoromycetidae sp. Uapishka_2]